MTTNIDTVMWEDFTIANDANGWRVGEWVKTDYNSTATFNVSGGVGQIVSATTSAAGDATIPVKSAVSWKDTNLRYFDATIAADSLTAGGSSIASANRPVIMFHWNGSFGAAATGYAIWIVKSAGGTSTVQVGKFNGTTGALTSFGSNYSLTESGGAFKCRVRVTPGISSNIIQFKMWTGASEPTGGWNSVSDGSPLTGGRFAVGMSPYLLDTAGNKTTFSLIRITRLAATDDTPTTTVALSGADTTNQATYTTASYTAPGTTKAYLLFVANSHGTNVQAITPTGLGLTWTEVGTVGGLVWSSSQRRLQAFYARGVATTGTLSLASGSATTSGCAWILHEITNSDPTASTVVTHSNTGSGSGVATASYTPTSTATLDSTPHVLTLSAIVHAGTANTTAPTGLRTETAEVAYATPTVNMQATRGSTPVATDGSWGVTWTTSAAYGWFYVAIRNNPQQAQSATSGGVSFSMG